MAGENELILHFSQKKHPRTHAHTQSLSCIRTHSRHILDDLPREAEGETIRLAMTVTLGLRWRGGRKKMKKGLFE